MEYIFLTTIKKKKKKIQPHSTWELAERRGVLPLE